jgi:hypothetical protein
MEASVTTTPRQEEALTMRSFEAKRVHRIHQATIQSPVDEVFPLACPVEEYKWIHGWECEMIYSEGGKNENNCIFSEQMSAPFLYPSAALGPTIWYTNLWDATGHRVHFVLITSLSVAKYEIEMFDQGNGTTLVQWDFTLTAVKEEGNPYVDDSTADRMTGMMTFLGDSLRHYCETGQILKGGAS